MIEYITKDPIEPHTWHLQRIDSKDGASVEFLGIVRGEEKGRPIDGLEYEAYVPMAEQVITALIEEAKRKWPFHQIFVRHRIGRVAVGEVSVVIGIQAPHRKEAFDACQFLIDAIKRDAPIWKKSYVKRTDPSDKRTVAQRD